MKELKLQNTDKVALVDDEDYDRCNERVWTLSTFGYAVSRVPNERWRRGTYIWLHHFVLYGMERKGLLDHKDRIKLNCQKLNIRIGNKSINTINRGLRADNSTGYKGVCWDRRKRKYVAYITLNGVRKHLGRFFDKIEAAIAYDDAAIILHGELAVLNFPLYGA